MYVINVDLEEEKLLFVPSIHPRLLDKAIGDFLGRANRQSI